MLFLQEAKDGRYSVKLLYRALDRPTTVLFPFCLIWNAWVPTKVGFFCLRSFMGQGVNPRPTQKEGKIFSQ